jgi:phosphohistidine phosphatase
MTSVPLRLDLVRHGEAEPSAGGGDAARKLSAAGRAAIERLAERLTRDGWRPTTLWASPLTRAQQTATILARACPGLTIGTLDALLDQEPADLVDELVRLEVQEHVVLVGHQPLMGRLVSWLTGNTERAFRAGQLVRVEAQGTLGHRSASIVLEIPPPSA